MRNEDISCPYKLSGLCYRKGCIHIPHLSCMKKREYDDIIKSYKFKKKKGHKHYEYQRTKNF